MNRTELPNIHIHYDQSIRPYHRVVGKLASQHLGESGSVLDIGCGVGHTLQEIRAARPGANLAAADIDPVCLETTRERVGLERSILIQEFDELFSLPHRFDVVIMSHTLEHLQRPVDAVKGVLGLLNEGGVLVLAVPNPVMPTVVLGNLWKRNWSNPGHVCVWDRAHWINFLERICRLEVLEYSQDFVPFPYSERLRVLRPVEILLSKIFPWFSMSNIAVVRGGPSLA